MIAKNLIFNLVVILSISLKMDLSIAQVSSKPMIAKATIKAVTENLDVRFDYAKNYEVEPAEALPGVRKGMQELSINTSGKKTPTNSKKKHPNKQNSHRTSPSSNSPNYELNNPALKLNKIKP